MKTTCPFCKSEFEVTRTLETDRQLHACSECLNPILLTQTASDLVSEGLADFPDVRTLSDEGSLSGMLLARARKSLDNLPILPEVSQRVLRLTNDSESSISDLSELLLEDAVIAAKVLQVANSAFYRGMSEVTNIDNACARLGMRTVANTIQSIAMGQVFKTKDVRSKELMRKLWRHAIATAHLSSETAILLSIPHSDTIYLMGLIHDIGKIALLNVVADSKNKELEELRENAVLFDEMLERLHPLLGLHVALHWDLPVDLAVPVFYHHMPESAPSERWRRLTHVVALADCIAHVSDFPSEHEKDVSLPAFPSASFFSLNDVKIATLRVNLEERMEAFLAAVA